MAIPDFTKLLLEAVISKTISDLQTNPDETLRRLLEKKTKANDPAHAAFLDELKAHLSKHAAYPSLLRRLVNEVETQRLKTLALNLIYHVGKRGQERLRAQELRHGVHIPWTMALELGDAITPARLSTLVEQGKELGICVYQFVCRTKSAFEGLRDLAEQHSDCIFAVYLPPECLDAARLSEFRALPALLPVLMCRPGEGEAQAQRLRENALFFGFCLEYGAGDAEVVRNASYASFAERTGAAFALYWPQAAAPQNLREELAHRVEVRRREGKLALLEARIPEDIRELDRLLSKEEAFLMFDQTGQRVLMGVGNPRAKENIVQNELLSILDAL